MASPRQRKRCIARSSRTGKPCRAWAVHGADVCVAHGGAAPQVKAKAVERVTVARARRMVAKAGVDRDPIEHLLDSLHEAAALVTAYGEMVADLDNAAEVDLQDRPGGLRGEVWWEVVDTGLTEVDDEGNEHPVLRRVPKADRLLALDRHGMAHLHPFVTEFHRLIEVRAKLAKLALDAGVQERRVRLVEQQGQLIAQAVRGILQAAGVDMSRPDLPGIIRQHLRLVVDNTADDDAA